MEGYLPLLDQEIGEDDVDESPGQLEVLKGSVVPLSLYAWTNFVTIMQRKGLTATVWTHDQVLIILRAKDGVNAPQNPWIALSAWKDVVDPAQKVTAHNNYWSGLLGVANVALAIYRTPVAERTPVMKQILLRVTCLRSSLYNVIANHPTQRVRVRRDGKYQDLARYLNVHRTLVAGWLNHEQAPTLLNVLGGLYRLYGYGFGIDYTRSGCATNGVYLDKTSQNIEAPNELQPDADFNPPGRTTEQLNGFFARYFTAVARAD